MQYNSKICCFLYQYKSLLPEEGFLLNKSVFSFVTRCSLCCCRVLPCWCLHPGMSVRCSCGVSTPHPGVRLLSMADCPFFFLFLFSMSEKHVTDENQAPHSTEHSWEHALIVGGLQSCWYAALVVKRMRVKQTGFFRCSLSMKPQRKNLWAEKVKLWLRCDRDSSYLVL